MYVCIKKWISFQHVGLLRVIAPLYLLQSKRRQLRDVININKFRNYESCGSKRGIENVLALSPFALISMCRSRHSNLALIQEYTHRCANMFVKIYLFISIIGASVGVYTTISSKANNVTFKYMKGIEGESDLHQCKPYEVCNVIHDRFWMSSLTERLCRCPHGQECPWQWTKIIDNSSLSLNNKSILKFCTQIMEELEICAHRQEAVIVSGESDLSNNYIIPYNVTVNCICPQTHYWKLQKYTYEEYGLIQVFKCVKKRRCETLDFCGYIRSDLYSTYYRCTCPEKHICIFKDQTQVNIQELLYSGPAYMAYCHRL